MRSTRAMVTQAALTTALLLAGRVELAEAGSCGGGGGGGGSSSSSSSSTPACSDTSDVVGYRHCTGYGRWATNLRIPLIVFELGTSVHSFASPLTAHDGSVEHEAQEFSYRAVDPGSRGGGSSNATAVTTTLRVAMGRTIYGAGEVELGGLVSDPTHVEMTSSGSLGKPTIEQSSAIAYGGLAVVGAQGATRNATFGVELAGGMRGVTYHYSSRYLACETTDSVSVARAVLEARARAATWVTPLISVGVSVGASVIDQHDWSAGLFMAAHTQAFGGGR